MAKQLWEDEARDRFLEYLVENEHVTYDTASEDVPVSSPDGPNFDYLLTTVGEGSPAIALEIFRLTPAEYELKQDSTWGDIVRFLKIELEELGISGYLVRVPKFTVSKTKRSAFARVAARKLAQQISLHAGTKQFEYDGYTISQIPELKGVVFSSLGGASFYDPVTMAKACLDDNIEKKNKQLALTGCRRVLLIINWNPLVDPTSLLTACSRFDFETYGNIDEVYFESSPGHTHRVVDRSVYIRVEKELTSENDLNDRFFLRLVEARLRDRDPHAFNIVKKLATVSSSTSWLSNDGAYSLIPISEALLERDELENALWVIRQLRSNEHANIRTLLCWPIQKLVAKNHPEYYPELLDILEQYAHDSDEGVRSHVPIPLCELAARRRSKNKDGSAFMSREIGDRIRGLTLAMLRDSSNEVIDRLAWVFPNLRDVSDQEALDIVQILAERVDKDGREDAAALMLYFAVFRSAQFQDLGPFDAVKLQSFLTGTITNGRASLRSSMVWTIGKALKEDVKMQDVLPYLRHVPEGEYDRGTFGHLYRMISDDLKAGESRLCKTFLAAIKREAEFLQSSSDHQVWHFEDFFESVRLTATLCKEVSLEIKQIILPYRDRFGVSEAYLAQLFGPS
jgi:hypothetical protein